MTDVEQAWSIFTDYIGKNSSVQSIIKTTVAGIPFIYVKRKDCNNLDKSVINQLIKEAAAFAMKGKRLTLSLAFVREDKTLLVYRVRFLVPQEKMFCCGNLCDDCIRFKSN